MCELKGLTNVIDSGFGHSAYTFAGKGILNFNDTIAINLLTAYAHGLRVE
jgi:hypothetical protein